MSNTMPPQYLLALDVGTQSVRALVYGRHGELCVPVHRFRLQHMCPRSPALRSRSRGPTGRQ